MGYKIQNVLESAHKKVNENFSEYINYLHVMGNNYKYSAMEQLNIFFIRPEAVACAEYDFWKENFNRVVERNQKGIPVYSIRNGKKNVRYIFDVTQTVSLDKRNDEKPKLWEFNNRTHKDVFERMTGKSDFEEAQMELINQTMLENSKLDTFNYKDAEVLESFIKKSVLIALDQRMGINKKDIFNEKEKEIYSLFSDFRTMELISSEISKIAKKVLIKVSKEIQKINDETVLEQNSKIGYEKMKKMRRNWNMLKKMINGKEYLIENGIYTPVVKETSYEQAGGNYKMILMDKKFQVLIPNLEEEKIDLSRLNSWGRARMKYLEQEKAEFLKNLLMKGEVMKHLFSIQTEVEKFWEIEKPKMMKVMGLTEELKEKDQMEWVRLMNSLLSSLREITYNQIIYK